RPRNDGSGVLSKHSDFLHNLPHGNETCGPKRGQRSASGPTTLSKRHARAYPLHALFDHAHQVQAAALHGELLHVWGPHWQPASEIPGGLQYEIARVALDKLEQAAQPRQVDVVLVAASLIDGVHVVKLERVGDDRDVAHPKLAAALQAMHHLRHADRGDLQMAEPAARLTEVGDRQLPHPRDV